MFRIDSEGSIEGTFTDGNPQIGQEATFVTAAWLNEIQEEIARVVEGAGIELEKGDRTQLLAAIVAIVAGGGGGGDVDAVPVTREVNGGGLVTGGGPLAADLVLTVAKALAADILAGTSATKAIVPAELQTAFGGVKASTGYRVEPGGFLRQWGVATCTGGITTNVSLPTTFTQCTDAGCQGGTGTVGAQTNPPYVNGLGTNTISIFNPTSTVTVIWWAEGWI